MEKVLIAVLLIELRERTSSMSKAEKFSSDISPELISYVFLIATVFPTTF